jgi:hypothetical protein
VEGYDAYISELGADFQRYAATVIGPFVGTQIGTNAVVVGREAEGTFVSGSASL